MPLAGQKIHELEVWVGRIRKETEKYVEGEGGREEEGEEEGNGEG